MSEGERERERYEWGERVSMHSVCVYARAAFATMGGRGEIKAETNWPRKLERAVCTR